MAKLNDIIEGLQIIARAGPPGDVEANHDEIYAGTGAEPDDYAEADRKRLEELRWTWSDEYDCWHKFT